VFVPGNRGRQGATAEVRKGDDAARARVLNSQSAASDRGVQTVQVLEGNEAMIRIGRAVPVRSRRVIQTPQGTQISESVDYRDADRGFRVRPRVNGDRVKLEISASRVSVSDQNAQVFNVQRVDTVVSGRLGEWLEIAGVDQSRVQTDVALLSGHSGSMYDGRKVLLKVEKMP
jgi:hypothetical protein